MERMLLSNSEKEIILRKFLQIKHSWTARYRFTWPCKPCEIPLPPPQNTWGCAVPWKYARDKHHSEARGSCPRAANTWAKSQRFRVPNPTALIWVIWLAHHPVSTGFTILASSRTLFSAPHCAKVQGWLCCPLQTELSAVAGASFLPVRFPPVRFLLSPVAQGRVVHMESQVDRPFPPNAFQTAPCLRLAAFPGSENWNLVSKLTLPTLSKEVYLNPLKSMPLLNKENMSQGSPASVTNADRRFKGDLWH